MGREAVPSSIFVNFGDTTLIQNMELSTLSMIKYLIANEILKISQNDQKMHFVFYDEKFPNSVKSKYGRIFNHNVFSSVSKIGEQYF